VTEQIRRDPANEIELEEFDVRVGTLTLALAQTIAPVPCNVCRDNLLGFVRSRLTRFVMEELAHRSPDKDQLCVDHGPKAAA
jgi:hypothetical protein